jgi:inositol 1,4,5-triphosphate receptor type 1
MSIWMPRVQIALTFALFVIFAYFFSLIAYISYAPLFVADKKTGQLTCDTLIRCLVTVIDTTFKFDGGVGSFLYDPNP